jgi:hypothetical protein
MALLRRLRTAADRSQLILLSGAALIVVALVGFAQLAVEKNAAMAANQEAQALFDNQAEQNRLLKSTLEQARMGERIAPKAFEYFDSVAPGVTIIRPEAPAQPEAPAETAAPAEDRPEWLVRIALTWEESLGRVAAALDDLIAAAGQRLQP